MSSWLGQLSWPHWIVTRWIFNIVTASSCIDIGWYWKEEPFIQWKLWFSRNQDVEAIDTASSHENLTCADDTWRWFATTPCEENDPACWPEHALIRFASQVSGLVWSVLGIMISIRCISSATDSHGFMADVWWRKLHFLPRKGNLWSCRSQRSAGEAGEAVYLLLSFILFCIILKIILHFALSIEHPWNVSISSIWVLVYRLYPITSKHGLSLETRFAQMSWFMLIQSPSLIFAFLAKFAIFVGASQIW